MQIKAGAIFITDAHYSSWRPQFKNFLDALESGAIQTPQLILMGDIFDLLMAPLRQSVNVYEEAIAQLNRIAATIDVIYLEGNHDFLLRSLFPSMTVVPIMQQPIMMHFGTTRITLLHGDKFIGLKYALYARIIRKRMVVYLLRFLNAVLRGKVLNALSAYLQRKDDCKKMQHFEAFIKERLQGVQIDTDILIEGHYHQGVGFKIKNFEYINLEAFACKQRYFIVQSKQDAFVLVHKQL